MTRAALATATAVASGLAFGVGPARAAEWPTPQAQAAHAEFLSTAPEPEGGAAAVCVVDTGVDVTTDVAPAVKQRMAIDGGTGDDLGGRADLDQPKHGTYVAGEIASQIDGVGSSGIWPRARIVSVRVFPGHGGGVQANDYILGIRVCENSSEPVKVINISLGGFGESDPNLDNLRDRITEARNRFGISVVAAAGNEGGTVTYPGLFPEALTVGAATPAGTLCSFSNRGTGLDLLAPGCGADATSAFDELTYIDGRLARGWGTSYAAPVASAALAALRSYKPTLTAADAEQLLMPSSASPSRPIDVAASFRAGGLSSLVDAYRAPAPAGGGGGGGGGATPEPVAATEPAPAREPETVSALPTPGVAGAGAGAVKPAAPSPPRLVALSYRKHILDVRVTGAGNGRWIVFELDGTRYVRSGGHLHVRGLHRWRVLRIRVMAADVESSALVIRRKTAR